MRPPDRVESAVPVPDVPALAQDEDEDSQPRAWFVAKCGHWMPLPADGRVDPCDCDL